MNTNIGTKIGAIVLIILTITIGVFIWRYIENGKSNLTQPQNVSVEPKTVTESQGQQIDQNTNETNKTYINEKYGFKMDLPKEMENNYKTHINPIRYEVGQKDKCVDCSLIQFVVTTEDKNTCDLMKCGEKILFVIWVRDIASWNHNHNNASYACIGESNIIAKTNTYAYTLCPFNISDSEKKYYPTDSLSLLEKTLPLIKSSFTVN